MMQRVFIHIGLPKTGTTFLQKRVFPDPLFLYLNSHEPTGRDADLNAAFTRFIETLTGIESLRQKTVSGNQEDFARAVMADGRPVILSGEELSAEWFEGDRSVTARRLHELFPQAQIILFIRSPLACLKSMYQQSTKGFGAKTYSYSFADYIDAALYLYLRDPAWRPESFDRLPAANPVGRLRYDLLIALYQSLFRRESVHVFTYEGFFSGDEYPRLMNLLYGDGADHPRHDLKISENAAVSKLLYSRNMAAGSPGAARFLRPVFGLLHRIVPSRFSGRVSFDYTPEQEETLRAVFAPVCRTVQELTSLDLRDKGYPI